MKTNIIYQGDCLEEYENIDNGSVDLILTDPPYGTVKDVGNANNIEHGMANKTEWDMPIKPKKLYNISNKLLRKNGRLILFSQQPYTTELIKKQITNLPHTYNMIWYKDHFANSLLSKKAPVNYYEDILVFKKENDIDNLHPLRKYFDKVKKYIGMNLKEINRKLGHRKAEHTFYITSTQFSLCTKQTYQELIKEFNIDNMQGFKTYQKLRKIDKKFDSTFNLPEGKKYKKNVLEYSKDYNGYHPTQKPVALLEDLIKTYTNEGNLVVDLTAGSGSTGVACQNTNRKYILIEKKQEYYEIAKERLNKKKKQLF